ncbi:GNAT family N-acetyltransferase [Gimesia aquarii]|uniref:Enhanced intracellular survival protein domain-containing protein n=1 Tax=Gimesia aquarii TaxID=2527964 RepID=A0A517X335_9PLAN|nr:GNAT family N-acetyltransferase [Gimesia aquarii]QDU11912.1 hypothetical protein V202x_53370 [Gimesia aquarii]
MNIQVANYDSDRDLEAVKRLWHEIGWLRDNSETEQTLLQTELDLGPVRVARIEDATESIAMGANAILQYMDSELPLAAVTGVGTSWVARKRGLARRVTARLIADMAAEGAALSMLGIFDQGYYDRLGFGTGSYDHRVSVQPQDLCVPLPQRAPNRLSSADWEEMHACRMRRMKRHGYVTFTSPTATQCESIRDDRFGFGFRDKANEALTHYLWCRTDDFESGPYHVISMVYENHRQLLELLGTLKSLEDQVQLVTLFEPPDIQLQDLVSRPFYRLATLNEGKFGTGIRSYAVWQARICNLHACLKETRLECEPLRFNLDLKDPIAEFLDDTQPWRGVAGQYVVTLANESEVEQGNVANLPTLTATVGAFTRLWLGVRPATGLVATDQLNGPPELLTQLDSAFRLPAPSWDWHF